MLNNPFCYRPSPSIVEAARTLASHIGATPSLHALFAEGKCSAYWRYAAPTG